jgi:hypothetical protein
MLAVKVKCSPFSNIRKIKATIDRDIVERNEKKIEYYKRECGLVFKSIV